MVVELTVRFYLINQEPTKLIVDVCDEGLRRAVDKEWVEAEAVQWWCWWLGFDSYWSRLYVPFSVATGSVG